MLDSSFTEMVRKQRSNIALKSIDQLYSCLQMLDEDGPIFSEPALSDALKKILDMRSALNGYQWLPEVKQREEFIADY